jgi:hypothetical protein
MEVTLQGEIVMPSTKTLAEREKELQALFATPQGKEHLEALATRYGAATGRHRPPKTSLITYLLVQERERGLIVG